MKKVLSSVLIITMLVSLLPGLALAETTQPPVAAFPGAEGGGMYTTGGRGGVVYEVTTLADSGPGSLREAVSQSNTTVVFRVGGTIHLQSPLKIIGSNLTVAGQTAPGEGITVADYTTTFDADNVIVRYLRFRLGDRHPSEDDAFGGRYHQNIIIDHCSFSWSVDEVMSMYENENTTVQWSIVSESMLMTTHQKGRHGYGGIWGGKNATFHHNLIAHNASRNPRLPGTSPDDTADYYNNVIYNWGFFSSYGGEQGQYNLRNNYYKYGPSTYRSVRNLLFVEVHPDSRMYIGGNVMDGDPEVTADNWKGVMTISNPASKLETPVVMPNPSSPELAEAAYSSVLTGAGAILPRRDAIDARVVQDVTGRTGQHINSQKEIGGYLEFDQALSTQADEDHDGMPDDWETARGLNPSDPSDRSGIAASGYTHLEEYLNGIVGSGSANPKAAITAPLSNAIVNEGGTVTIEATASDPDGTVEKVEFYRGDVKLGEDISPPYIYDWADVTDGTYFLTVKAIDNTGTSIQSDNVAVHVNRPGSIEPWQSADIGTPVIAGHTQLGGSPADVTVKSAGDIAGVSDNFHFAYRTLTGNGEVVARVDSVTATDDGAEAGVMIREDLTASSKMAAILIPYVKMGRKSIMLSRSQTGGGVAAQEPEAFVNTPYWVKMVRLGDQFTALSSKDGADWTVIGSATIPMADTVYFGLAADASKADDEVNKYNTSSFSNADVRALDPAFPLAPAGVTATAGNKSVALSWSPVSVAQSYKVFRSELPGGPYTEAANGLTEAAFTDTNLTPGLTYYYVVDAVNDKGVSFHSSEASATPTGEPETIYYVNDNFEADALDTTPIGYAVLPDPQDAGHKVTVVKVPAGTVGNDSGQALIAYDNAPVNTQFIRKFTKQTGTFVVEADVTSAAWPGTSIVLQLQDEAGSRTPLSIEIRKPTQPVVEASNTFIYKRSGADYKLTDPPVNNRWYNIKIEANVPAQKADIYIDQVLVADDAPFQADVTSLGIGRILAKMPGTGSGTIYYDNLKVYVEPIQTPKGLSALPGNGKVRLDWSASDGAASYSVKRSTVNGGPYGTVAASVTDVTYIDESVVNGTTYYYVVTATGPTGESGPSNQAEVTPSEAAVKPAAPAGLAASARSAQADLSWQPSQYASYYTVKRSTDQTGPYTIVAPRVSGTAYRDGGLSNDTVYYYTVSATSVGGEGPDSHAVSVQPTGQLRTPEITVQPKPESAIVSWGPVAGAASYIVKRAGRVEGPYVQVSAIQDGTIYTDSGLTNGSPYYYRVTAVKGNTHSLDSYAAGVRPSAEDGTPAAPAGLKAEPGDAAMTLSWSVSIGATGYNVKRSDSAEGPYTAVATNVTSATYTNTGLTNGAAYYYIVTAVNENGESFSSVPVSESPAPVLTVAANGSGQFTRVKDAITAVPDNRSIPTIIKIKDGTYREKLEIPSTKVKIRMIGESREGTVLVYGDNANTPDANGNPMGTANSSSFKVLASDFSAEHLTVQNDSGDNTGQAVALYTRGERMTFRDVSLRSWQDTFYASDGRQYFVDSYIEGDVDFIFGNAALVFENCIIHSLSGGYVTAASTPEGKPGYVFLNSRITAEPGLAGKVALGRPWRPYSNVHYINSYMDDHISPAGWDNWGNAANEATVSYGEFASYGPGANPPGRVNWSKQLTAEEAELLTPAFVLGGLDGWNPSAKLSMPDGNRQLSELTVNGTSVPGFDPEKLEYSIELPQGSAVPVTAAATRSEASRVTVTQASGLPGTAAVRVSAQDGGERVYTVVFAVVDRVPPTAEVSYSTTAPTNGDVTVTITPSEPVTVTNNDALTSRTFTENGSFTFEFIDAAGNKGTVTATVTNIDKKAPALKLSVNKPVLKADDHRLETIRVTATATDAESGIASVILRSITSSDPDDGIGDGTTGSDIQGAEYGMADFEFQLRAERSAVNTSRVYTITYRATDLAGNTIDVSTTVTVPR